MTPGLNASQRRRLDGLVAQRRLAEVAVDTDRATAFLDLATDTLADITHLRLAQNRSNLAYDAVHAVGEALLARFGYRTTSGAGQHEALVQFLRIVLDRPPVDAAARHADRMRRTRNQMHYEARSVSATDAAKAVEAAEALLNAAREGRR